MNVVGTLRSLQHLFFPHTCAGCGSDLLSHQQVICLSCTSVFPCTGFHHHADNPVEKIFWGRLPLQAATSYCWFSKGSIVQQLLHELKYSNHKQAGRCFGNRIGETLQQSSRFTGIDLIVPVPLHVSRHRQRGYNQAALIADGIAAVLNLPVITDAVTRVARTSSQTKRNRAERWQNMENIFRLQEPGVLTGRHLLLVDDVITTGATLEACGQALLTAGQVTLSIATLAFASR